MEMEWKLGVCRGYLWLAGNEGTEKKLETTIMGLGFRRNGKEHGNFSNG